LGPSICAPTGAQSKSAEETEPVTDSAPLSETYAKLS